MLCHSPQERLFIDGGWRDGLLPPIEALPAAERATTLAQYRAFGAAVARRGRRRRVRDPDRALALERRARRARPRHLRRLARRAGPRRAGAALVPRLLLPRRLRRRQRARSRPGPACTTSRAGTAFAPRATTRDADAGEAACSPGPKATPGSPSGSPRRSASGSTRAASCCASTRAATTSRSTPGTRRPGSASAGSPRRVVLATPLFVAARLLAAPPPALREAARIGAPRALAGRQPAARRRARRPARRPAVVGQRRSTAAPGLGYVDAMHQSTRPFAGPTVLTAYCRARRRRATRRSPSSAGACSATTGAPGPARVVAELAPRASRPRRARCAAST